MIEVLETPTFTAWLEGLKDDTSRSKITVRITRVRSGLFGDVEPVGEGVSELKIDYGPGFRVYFIQTGKTVVLLLSGGDKSSQKKDIKAAKKMAKEYK